MTRHEATSQSTSSAAPQEMLADFIGDGQDYYAAQFGQIEHNRASLAVNPGALMLGPLWAAGRRLWSWFWALGATELVFLTLIGMAIVNPAEVGGAPFHWPLAALILVRLAFALAANRIYFRQFIRWRADRSIATGFSWRSFGVGTALMAGLYTPTLYRFIVGDIRFLNTFPADKAIQRNFADSIEQTVAWLVTNFGSAFDAITAAIRGILNFLDTVFIGTPWPVTGFLFILIAWRTTGIRIAVFTAASLAYIALFGYWDKAMSTFSLVGASLVICLIIGIPAGILCAKRPGLYNKVKPTLDIMQTMPAFVYLIPAVAFFSIGKPPGVLATVIFAMPPMIRLTALGISQVPESVKEAALAFGASPRQLLFKVELPMSVPAIMTGVNQTIMMSLSMVVISALIGAGGLGYDIVFALNHVQAGSGILAGIAVALCAMILDRIIQGSGFARRD